MLDRDIKLDITIHAEVNAVLSSHVPVAGCAIYVTHPCCAACAAKLIQSGIRQVVTRPARGHFSERWAASVALAGDMFREAGVDCYELAQRRPGIQELP